VFSLDHKEPDAEHRQLGSRKSSARSRTPVSPPCTASQPRGGADAGGRPRHHDRGTRPGRGADRGHRRRGLFEPDAGQPDGPGRGKRLHLTTAVVDGRRDRRSQPATVAGGRARRGTRRRSPTAWRQGAPEHTLSPPVPIVATIRWAVDGEKHIDTVNLAGPAKPSTSASPTHAGPAGGRRARRKAGDDSACSHQPHSVSTLTPARGPMLAYQGSGTGASIRGVASPRAGFARAVNGRRVVRSRLRMWYRIRTVGLVLLGRCSRPLPGP
jgi:hypothetical protein